MSEELLFIHVQRIIPIAAADSVFTEINDTWSVARRTVSSCVRDYFLQLQYSLKEIIDTWLQFIQLTSWLSFRNQKYSKDEQIILKAIAILLLDNYLWHTIQDKLLFIGGEFMDYAANGVPKGSSTLAAKSEGATDALIYSSIIYSLLNKPYQIPPCLLWFQSHRGRSAFGGTHSHNPQSTAAFLNDAPLVRSYLHSLIVLSSETLHWMVLLLLTSPHLFPSLSLHWPVSNISLAAPSLCRLGRSSGPAHVLCASTAMALAFKPFAKHVDSDTQDLMLSMITQCQLSQPDLQVVSDIIRVECPPHRKLQFHTLCPKVYHCTLTMHRNLKALCLFPRNRSLLEAVKAFTSAPIPPAYIFSLKSWMKIPPHRLFQHPAIEPLSLSFCDAYATHLSPVNSAIPSPTPARSQIQNTPSEPPVGTTEFTPPLETSLSAPISSPSAQKLHSSSSHRSWPSLIVSSKQSTPVELDSVGSTVTLEAGGTHLPRSVLSSILFEYKSNVLLDARAASILYIVAATASSEPALHLAGIFSSRFDESDAAGYCFDFEQGSVYAVLKPHTLLSDPRGSLSPPLTNIKARKFPIVPGSAGAFYLSMSPHEISWGAQKSVKAKLELPGLPGDTWIDCHYFVLLGMNCDQEVKIITAPPADNHNFQPEKRCLRLHQCVVPSGAALPRHLHSKFYNRENLGRDSLAALLKPGKLELIPSASLRQEASPALLQDAVTSRRRSTTTDALSRHRTLFPECEHSSRDCKGGNTSDAGVAPVKIWRKRGRPPKKLSSLTSPVPTKAPSLPMTHPKTDNLRALRHRRYLYSLLLQGRASAKGSQSLSDKVHGGSQYADHTNEAISIAASDTSRVCPLCRLDSLDLRCIAPTPPKPRGTPSTPVPPSQPSICTGSRSLRLWESVPVRMDFGAPGRLNRFRYSAVSDRR